MVRKLKEKPTKINTNQFSTTKTAKTLRQKINLIINLKLKQNHKAN